MTPLHIVFFNRSYYPDTAATGQLLTELCESLVQYYNHNITVIAAMPSESERDAGPFIAREEHNGVKIVRVRGTSYSKRSFAGRVANYLSYFAGAWIAHRKIERPDVVVSMTDPPLVGLAAYRAARKFGVPFVMSYQDVFPEVARLLESFRSSFIDTVLDRVNRYLVRKADRIVTLGESMSGKLVDGKGADPSKIQVIPNWADCSAIRPVSKESQFSLKHHLTGKFVVAHSGNLGLSQSLDILINAAQRLRSYTDIEFLIIGEGVRKADLQFKAENLQLTNVRFLPFQPKDKLIESYCAADVFVISLKAGMSGYIVPSKLYGILASGRAYVAAIEGDSEAALIARDYNCGLVSTPDSATDLAEKLLTLYHDRNRTKQMGENARKAAMQFDRKVAVQKYYELFASLSGRNTPAEEISKESIAH